MAKSLHIPEETSVGSYFTFSMPRVQHTDLLKSVEDPNTYLVNSSGDPMQQSLSGLLLDGLPPSASAAFLPRTGLPLELTCSIHPQV